MLKVALAVLPMERGNRLGQGERFPKWIYFPNPVSKLGSWHTADRVPTTANQRDPRPTLL